MKVVKCFVERVLKWHPRVAAYLRPAFVAVNLENHKCYEGESKDRVLEKGKTDKSSKHSTGSSAHITSY